MSRPTHTLEPIARAIALEAGRILYGQSYIAEMKRQGFHQALYPTAANWLLLGSPASYEAAQ